MRRILYSVASSLDGFIAGPDGEYDWIPDEPSMDWDAFMARFDAVVMGRGTWEILAAQPPEQRPGVETYVFSDTLDEADVPGRVVRRSESLDFVRELKRSEGKTIWLMGGGDLFRFLLDAGLVDEVETALVPILLGGGLPLVPPGRAHRLRLESQRPYPSGIVLVTYEVEPLESVEEAAAATDERGQS